MLWEMKSHNYIKKKE
jgi:hypothetical protein